MKIEWHPLARRDMYEIHQYCKYTFGDSTAITVKKKIWHSTKLLKSYPCLGFVEPLLIDFGQLEYRSLIVGYTKVIYSIHTDYVYIHLLWNCRKDPESLSREMRKR